MPTLPRIAFLGLGKMGHPMAARLVAAGYPLTVWNRTASRGDDLVERGARRGMTPGAAARDAEVVITMLADPAAVELVLLGQDGVLGALRRGATVIDCSTVGPTDSRAFAAHCTEAGVRFVDAPVLGSVPQAEAGALVILAGGAAETLDGVEAVLRAMSKQVVRAGPIGHGSALKLVMNLLVGGLTELLAEAIVLAERAGLGKDTLRQTLSGSVLNSPFLGYKAPQLLERQFAPLFSTRLLLKDLNLVLDLARSLDLTLPATATVRDQYARSAAAGHAEQDFAAVIEEVEHGTGTRDEG